MLSILSGIVVLVITVVVFIAFLPRGDKLHRFVGTEFEPYIGVAFCSATALGLTLTLSGVLNLLSTQ